METKTSIDGTRCVGCNCFPDECTCRPIHPMRVIITALTSATDGERMRGPNGLAVGTPTPQR